MEKKKTTTNQNILEKNFPVFYQGIVRLEWLKVLWKCKLSIIAIGILFYVLWFNDQGKDLLISLQDETPLWLLFYIYILVGVFAGLNWYWPHLFLETTTSTLMIFKRNPDNTYRENKISNAATFIPRMVGVVTILVISGAIFNIWITEFHTWCMFLSYLYFLVLFILFMVIFSQKGSEFFNRIFKQKWVFWILILALVILLVSFIMLNYFRAHRIVLLAIGFVMLGLIYSFIVIFRREYDIYLSWTRWIKNIPVPYVLFGFAYALMLLFVIINLFISLSQKFQPFAMLTLGLLFYVMLINRIYYFVKKINVNSLVFTILFIIGTTIYFMIPSQHYNVRLKEHTAFERMPLDTYIVKWVENNKAYVLDYIEDKGSFPVFFVATHGGGSRSAYWTSSIATKLEDTTDVLFTKHLFSLSGASGGSVGSSFFTSFVANKLTEQPHRALYPLVDSVMRSDFLSSSITMLFGRDFWASFIPGIKCKDRSAILELEWGEALNATLKDNTDWFEKSIHELYYQSQDEIDYDLPLLFINTDKVENGQRGIITPVKLSQEFTSAIDLLDSIFIYHQQDNSSLRLSTSALLSARFPYVSSGGRIDPIGYFVDGGYFDNSAGLTCIDIMNAFSRVISEQEDTIYSKFDMYAVSIANDPDNTTKKCVDIKPSNKLNYISQIAIPPDAIIHIRDGYTKHYDEKLEDVVGKGNYIRFQLTREPVTIEYKNGKKDTVLPIIPLGRYISDVARESMRKSLYEESNFKQLERIIQLVEQ